MPAKQKPPVRAGGSEPEAVTWVRDYREYTEPITAEERAEAEAVARVAELGYRPAVQCTRCGAWLVAAKSVALHRGPVCRGKGGAA